MASGGIKNNTGKIEFIRLKKSGKPERRVFKMNDSATKGSYFNPILISGDLIHVKKNILGKSSDLINDFGAPLINGYGLYKIFD